MTADAGFDVKIKEDRYVYDNVSGGTKFEVERMEGQRFRHL